MKEGKTMKFITNRQEVAKKINLDNIPVLTIDISKCMNGYDNCYEGSKVRLLGGHSSGYEDLTTECTVKMYGDEEGNECHAMPWTYKKIVLTTGCVCIKSSFGLSDVDRMVEWSNTKILKANDTVLVYFRGEDMGFLREMKVGAKINPHCSTAAVLVDVD